MKGDHWISDDERGKKLFDNLFCGDKFQDGLNKIRRDFNIPAEGFLSKEEIYSHYGDLSKTFFEAVDNFIYQQGLPDNEWWQREIIESIISKDRIQFLPRTAWPISPFVEIIERSDPKSSAKYGSYVDIRLYEGVSQRDIINFVKHHGGAIRPSTLIGRKRKIRKDLNEKRNKEILANCRKTKKQLGALPGEKVTKEILIGRRVNASAENVRIINYRKKKSKR